MKFILIILQLTTFAISSEIAFNCHLSNITSDLTLSYIRYYRIRKYFASDWPIYYGCKHEDQTGITEPNVTVTSIVGDHKEGSTNNDVTMLIYKGSTKYLAKEISKFFPNIEIFRADEVGLEHVSRSDFEGLSKIFYLTLGSNKLQDIPDDTFFDLVNLEVIWLQVNKLEKVPNLKTLSKLKYIDLGWNEIKSITAENLSGNKELKSINLWYNKITFIDQNIFEGLLPKLETAAFIRNTCIDSNFEDDDFMDKVQESCQNVQ